MLNVYPYLLKNTKYWGEIFMKKNNIIIFVSVSTIIIAIVIATSFFTKSTTLNTTKNNTSTSYAQGETIVTSSSKEKFLNSLSELNKISYLEADELNNDILSKANKSTDEIEKYKTITKKFKVDSNIIVEIFVDIEYIYSNTTNKASSIVKLGQPSINIVKSPSSNTKWSGSDFNIDESSNDARISIIGQIQPEGYSITDAYTYIMKIPLSDLNLEHVN